MNTLSPFDLLLLPDGEQAIFRALTKRPKQTVKELAHSSMLTLDEVHAAIAALLEQGSLVEQLQEGKRIFSVRLQFKRKTVKNMPASILEAFEKAPHAFLHEVPLTRCLSEAAMASLLELSSKRTLLPDEVLSWQGEKFGFVAVVEAGLIVRTRLKGNHISEKIGYCRRTEWIGISSVLNDSAGTETFTAVTETNLLVWSKLAFVDFLNCHNELAIAICHQLSQSLEACKSTKTNGLGKLWVIEGESPAVGVSLFAEHLALCALASGQDTAVQATLLWKRDNTKPIGRKAQRKIKELASISQHPAGYDQLHLQESHEYPPQVQLDILLGELLTTYEYIICDTGSDDSSELYQRLRGQGHALITVTDSPHQVETMLDRWQNNQHYAIPNQKRLLALNNTAQKLVDVDPRFHIVIPQDETIASQAATANGASIYQEAIGEIYRRLSLNHALALFVPSTLDVDEPIDNAYQVQSTLQFFGNTFGGATKSDGEGVWRSEDSGLVTEQVTIVRTFVSKNALETHLDSVVEFATNLKKEMKQEAVALSIDHQLILV